MLNLLQLRLELLDQPEDQSRRSVDRDPTMAVVEVPFASLLVGADELVREAGLEGLGDRDVLGHVDCLLDRTVDILLTEGGITLRIIDHRKVFERFDVDLMLSLE